MYRSTRSNTRLANVYGGGDANGSRLVPEAALSALAGRAPVVRSDGTPERDFLYVEDAVDAYLALWRELGECTAHGIGDSGFDVQRGEVAGEAFNGGGGTRHTVLEVVELVCQLAGTGVEPDIRGTGTPAGEIGRQWVDSSKLRAATGWEPRTKLEEGLRRTINWYRQHPEWLEGSSQEAVSIA